MKSFKQLRENIEVENLITAIIGFPMENMQ